MTTKELIAELKKYSEDLKVVFDDTEYGFSEVSSLVLGMGKRHEEVVVLESERIPPNDV